MKRMFKPIVATILLFAMSINSITGVFAEPTEEIPYLTESEMIVADSLIEEKAQLYQQSPVDYELVEKINEQLFELGVRKIQLEDYTGETASTYGNVVLPSSANVEYDAYHIKTNYQGVVYDCEVITATALPNLNSYLRTTANLTNHTITGKPSARVAGILLDVALGKLDTYNVYSTYQTIADLFNAVNTNYSTTTTYNVKASYTFALTSTTKHIAVKPDGGSDGNIMIGYFGEKIHFHSVETMLVPVTGATKSVTNTQDQYFNSSNYNAPLTAACQGYVRGVTVNERVSTIKYKVNGTVIKTISVPNHQVIYDPVIQ